MKHHLASRQTLTDQPFDPTGDNAKHRQAIAMTLLAALLWSSGGILIKLISLDALAIAGGRSLIGAIVVAVFVGIPRRPRLATEWGATVTYFLTVTLFVLATKLTTAANAVLLQYMAPVYVALFSRLYLNEVIRKVDVICLVVGLFGMILFFLDDLTGQHLLGNLVAIASGMSFAWFILFMRRQKDAEPIVGVFYGNILAAVVCLPMSDWLSGDATAYTWLLLLGIIQLGIPYIVYSKAIRHIQALESTIILLLEPILNPIWVFLVIGEKPGRFSILGGALVLSVIVLRGLIRHNRHSRT